MQKAAGVHLGLYLSRRIVEAHGGELYADSQPGEGNELAQRPSNALELEPASVQSQAPPHPLYYYVIL
jgi:K+-sensing histidine kinase KdpD